MKQTKRIFSLLLALALLLTCAPYVPLKAEAATIVDSGTCGDNLTWTLDEEGTLTISGTGAMTNYTDYTRAPWKRSSVKKVVIGDSVTTIGDYAFKNCSKLTSVTIPDSVTTIGDSAFYGCDGLTSVTIGDSVITIGKKAFGECGSLTKVEVDPNNENYSDIGGVLFSKDQKTIVSYPGGLSGEYSIPDSVTTIGSFAFPGCTGLTSVTIGNSVETIGDYAFDSCSWLTSVTIGNSVETIGDYAFYKCSRLTSVTIPDSVTSIGDHAFYCCTDITSVTIGNSVETIGEYAFDGCYDLTSVTIGNSVETIGDYAFYKCTNLTSVTFPDSVTSIGNSAFYGTAWYDAQPDGLVYAGKVAYKYKGTCPSEVVIKEDTLRIGDRAFYECTSLTSVDIPDSVTAIGDYAFYKCNSLTGVTIGNSVETIGDYAFYNCENLTNMTIGNSVETIGDYAFYNCENLTNMTIGNSVETIGESAFYSCENLTNVTIGNSVTAIGDSAFKYCDSLTSVTIPDSVTSIGDYAFVWCENLTSVTIGNSVETIGKDAFSSCSGLTSVDINDLAAWCEIEFVSDSSNPFAYAEELYLNGKLVTDLIIPYSTTTIKDYAFYRCTGLTSVTIPDSVTSIGDYAFVWCENLTSVTIGDSVETIGESAFAYCHGLNNVTIGNSVETIGERAFSSCAFTSIDIPDSVTSIGDYAFSSLSNCLIYFDGKAPDIGDNAFYQMTATVYYRPDETWTEEVIQNYGGNITWVVQEIVASGKCGDNSTWTLANGGIITISGSGKMYDSVFYGKSFASDIKAVRIGDSVTTIGTAAFYWLTSLTSVDIGASVTTIGSGAFYNCGSLTSVTIPYSVITIGPSSFYGCNELKIIYFDGSAPDIGDDAFSDVTATAYYYPDETWTEDVMQDYGGNITWVALDLEIIASGKCGDNLTWKLDSRGLLTISGSGAMYNFDSYNDVPWASYREDIKLVDIGDSVTTIGDCAFSSCASLTNVFIPDSVLTIGNSAFPCCTSLASVTIPDSVTSIGDYAFRFCENLTDLTIPDSVLTIGDYAFGNCTSLTSVDIGDSVTTIGASAFRDCTNLATVTIPDSVTTIGDAAFSFCSFTSIDIPDSVTTIGSSAFSNCDLTSVTIPASVTSIGSGVFTNCRNLTEINVASNNKNYCDINDVLFSKDGKILVCYPGGKEGTYTIPDSVTTIRKSAFWGCGYLTSVTMGNHVTTIEEHAFYGCSLASIMLADSVTTIGESAFESCYDLTRIDIPASVTSIGTNAFAKSSCLTEIKVAPNNEYYCDINDVLFSKDGKILVCYPCGKEGTYTIPDSVTTIGDYAFFNCESLKKVIISDSVTTIGNFAFEGCESLTSMTIGNSVTTIGNLAFYNCTGLTSVTIPDSVTSIGNSAFYNCTGLTSVNIGNSVTTIGDYALENCTNIEEIYFDGSAPTIYDKAFLFVSATAYYYPDETWTEDVMQDYGGTITWKKRPCNHPTFTNWEKVDDTNHKRTCTVCETHTESAAHAWDDGVVTKTATCKDTGIMTYTCAICNGTKTETIPVTDDHVFGEWEKADDANHKRTCTVCEAHTETASHAWGTGVVTKAATCKDTGIMSYTCSTCNGTKTETIPVTDDHVFGEWEKADDANHKRTCTVCEAHTETAAHTWGTGVVTKAATCKDTGIMTYTCSTCNGTKTETIPVTDDHVFGEWEKADDANHKRTCTVCEAHTETASHAWGTGVVTKAATCKDTGIMTYTCSTCNGTKTETIPVTDDHVFGEWEQVDETHHKHTCTVCTTHTETKKHNFGADHVCTDCGYKAYVVGDFTGDGLITDEDVIYLLWYTVFPEDYPLNQSGDIDGDGYVTDADVIYLLWYTVFPEDYPLKK